MRPLRRVALGPLLALAAVALGCAGCASSGTPVAVPTPAPTPLARLNTAVMVLPRIDFCTLVPAVAVRHALGGAKGVAEHWNNGGRTDVPGVGEQVVAEHGCAWTAGAAAARAWTYAPPVRPALARAVVGQAGSEPGCHEVHGPTFGQPSLTQVCARGGTQRVRHAGLFGDTWLTCEVTDAAPAQAVRRRADAWCVDIANTLNMTR